MEPGLLKSADWPLLIDVYFFLGGLSAGAFVVASAAALLDRERYRTIVRVGYYIAFLAILPCPILLIADLGIPSRFLHMMMVAKPSAAIGDGAVHVGPFHLKPLSPMNVGAWALLGYSLAAFVAALDVFMEHRGGRPIGGLRTGVAVVGGVLAFFLAGYPGVLLGATARPLFVGGHWLGALFLAVGASTGAAAIALVLAARGGAAGESLGRLMRFIAYALVIQAAALVLFGFTVSGAGSAGLNRALAQLLSGPHSMTFWGGAVLVGLVLPLVLQLGGGRRAASPGLAAVVALLVLVGGFLVKYVLIVAGQAA
jgi:formate-dependent nitrite reductase membrane component NrfD